MSKADKSRKHLSGKEKRRMPRLRKDQMPGGHMSRGKQAFVWAVVRNGNDLVAAYLRAYPGAARWKEATIQRKATDLARELADLILAHRKMADRVRAARPADLDPKARQRRIKANDRSPRKWRERNAGDLAQFEAEVHAVDKKTGQMIVTRTNQIADAEGSIGSPAAKVMDGLSVMFGRGTISRAQLSAAERFRTDFDLGHCDPLHAPALDRVPGQGGDLSGSALAARQRVGRVMNLLGGAGSPCGDIVWEVVGRGLSIKEWCLRRPWGRTGRHILTSTASGILIGALSILDEHYAGERRGGAARPRDRMVPGKPWDEMTRQERQMWIDRCEAARA